jgi:hypothetical protein
LESQAQNTSEPAVGRVLEKAFDCFFNYVSDLVGAKKAMEYAEKSHQEIEKYFSSLSYLKLEQGSTIKFMSPDVSDKEVLGFSIWMRQFLKELKDSMVGLGNVDPEKITGDLTQTLKKIGFFEYFDQAKELKY